MPDVEGVDHTPDDPARPVEDRAPADAARAEARLSTERQLAALIAERDRRVAGAGQQAFDSGFAAGVKIGRVEAEGEHLDQIEHTLGCTGPTTFDAAVAALDAATKLVHRVDVAGVHSPAGRQLLIEQQAHGVTELADHLVRWLSEHIEVDVDAPIMDEVQWATAARCTACGASTFAEHADDCSAAPPVEPCPECRAGKHGNCPGRVLNRFDKWRSCPCGDPSHGTAAE